METKEEVIKKLSGKSQQMSVELYKVISTQEGMDQFMKNDLLSDCIRFYTNAAELTEREDDFFRDLGLFSSLCMYCVSLNAQLLMCYQLGVLNSDVCIEFGYKIEEIKADANVLLLKAKKDVEDQNPFKDFDGDE